MRKTCLVVTAMSLGFLAKAQQDTTSKTLEQVIVTANKFPQKLQSTGKVITVITEQELQRNTGRQLGDVLLMQSGLIINGAQNTPGTNTDVYMRGASTGKSLILIDGIPVYDPSSTSSAFDLNLIPVDQVQRVEILKGSQSTLYGSDALAGVINIITKKGKGKPINGNISIAGGSYGTFKGTAGLNGQAGKTAYNFQYTRYQSDGFSSAKDSTGNANFDNDGFKQNSVLFNLAHQLNADLKLRVTGQYADNRADLDAAAFTDEKDFTFESSNLLGGIGLDWTIGKSTIHLNYYYDRVKRVYVDDSLFVGGFDTYSKGQYEAGQHYLETYSNIRVAKQIDLVAGIEYKLQNTSQDYLSISSFGPYKTALGKDSAKLEQIAAYLSGIFNSNNGLGLELGARFNHINKYGDVATFSINPFYRLRGGIKFFGNLSSGFKAPTLYQLYSEFRNPYTELKPEKSISMDAGIEYAGTNINASATYFRRRITDNILFYSEGPPNYASYYINTNKQDNEGVELELRSKLNRFSFAANYTYVKGEVTTNLGGHDTTYNNLFRIPEHTFNLSVGVEITDKLLLNAGFRLLGERMEPVFSGQPISVEGYNTIDLYGEYRVSKKWKVFADVKNLFDKSYMDIYGYTARGINFLAGTSIQL